MTDNDIEKILHRAAELQGLRSSAPGPAPSDTSERQRLGFVAEAAEEVGISRTDFALATAEVTGSPRQKPVNPVSARRARRWLGHEERVHTLDATLSAPPAAVLAALQSVLAGSDHQVPIVNMVGDNPLVDGVLVLEPADWMQLGLNTVTPFRYAMLTADFRQVLVTLRADPDRGERTLLRFHAALDHSAVLNYQWSVALTGVFAPLAAVGVVALAAPLGVPAMVGLGAGALVASVLGLRLCWRAWYRWGLDQGRKALQDLVGRVSGAVRLKGL